MTDSIEDTEEIKQDDDIFIEDEENEEEWRKKRLQREMVLKEKSMSREVDDILGDSQMFKIGLSMLKKSGNNTPNSSQKSLTEPTISLLVH